MTSLLHLQYVAIASGLLYLAALLLASATASYAIAADLALLGLGACVICYNAIAQPPSRLTAFVVWPTWALSWMLGAAATICFIWKA